MERHFRQIQSARAFSIADEQSQNSMIRSHIPGFPISRRRVLAIGAFGAVATLSARRAGAAMIDITQGNFRPMPIAIPEFLGVGGGDTDSAHAITQIVAADLQRSGLFAPIDPAAFVERIASIDSVPSFPDWRSINAQALVTGRIGQQGGDGRLKAEFRLWDI